MDDGNVVAAGQSLATCSGRNGRCMVQWRTNVRYVTQHKADLPGSPRDFILRIQSFYSQSTLATLSEDKTMTQTISNLQHWGMGESMCDNQLLRRRTTAFITTTTHIWTKSGRHCWEENLSKCSLPLLWHHMQKCYS